MQTAIQLTSLMINGDVSDRSSTAYKVKYYLLVTCW